MLSAPMDPAILLFDIDGTLVLTGGAGRRALGRAFGEVIGRPDALDTVKLAGMTDLLICRDALAAVGEPFDRETVDAVFAAYLGFLEEEVAASPGYRVMPGVYEVVAAVVDRPGIAAGLGTGNMEAGARIKLGRAGLSEPFAFGGFGSDAEDRAELLAAGRDRGAARLGVPASRCRVVVVGDTPRDVRAAHAIGAVCVGVGTATFSSAQLADAGADWAFDDLRDPRALPVLLGEGR